MIPPSTYTATCWRDGPAWVVQIPELGRSARAARLSQVEGVARSLVATFAEEQDAAACRVVVDLVVRHSVTELLAAAAAARADSDRVSVEAVTLRRALARQLAAEGFDVRDVAALLGLSYGRALQLIGDAPHGIGRPHAVPVPAGAPRFDAGLVPRPDGHPTATRAPTTGPPTSPSRTGGTATRRCSTAAPVASSQRRSPSSGRGSRSDSP